MSISNSKPFLNLSILSLYFLILSNHPLLTASLPIEINHKYGIATTNVSSPPPNPPTTGSGAVPFRPGIAATLGVLAIIISIAIILLLYAQHCNGIYANYIINSRSIPLSRENSGVDTKVIQKLPLFRFASLKGQKDGLECAVCLTNFDSDEVLRLLPKCKHAFHVECVDTWLLTHSTCPLCRYRVDPEDMPHESYKSLYNYKDTNDDSNERGKALEIIVENPDQDFDPERASSGVSTSGQRRDDLGRDSGSKSLDGKVQGRKHRVEHRIIVSSGGEEVEGEGRRRWSDVEAVDFLYLRSEMIMEGGGSGRRVISRRSLSERIGMSRHRNNNGEGNGERSREEEGVGKRWLAWISRSQQKTADVPPPNSASSPVIV